MGKNRFKGPIYSPKSYSEMPENKKWYVGKIAKYLLESVHKPYEFERKLMACMDKMYMEGLAAVTDGEVVEEGRCICIDRGIDWEIACPYCGEVFDINMEGMLQDSEEYKVKL